MNITSLFLVNKTQNVIAPEFLSREKLYWQDTFWWQPCGHAYSIYQVYESLIVFPFISQAFRMGKNPLKDSTYEGQGCCIMLNDV